MAQNRHTPGPWRCFKDPLGHDFYEVEGKPGIGIAMVHSYPNIPPGFLDTEANAHLIAAAPELLTALEGLADTLDDALLTHIFENEKEAQESSYAATIESARALIAKARGKED